jgi:HEAT repeat protein
VLEWERRGSAAEACGEIMLDTRLPEFMRRRAMLARLTALEAEDRAEERSPNAEALRVRLARELGQVQLYAVLAPLEHLFAQGTQQTERRVKVAVLQAVATLFFKRSFVTVRAGLADADPTVVGHAVEALGAFVFEHAFDPLARLVRESSNPAARGAALGALAQMDTADAAELLLGVLEHGSHADRAVAADALKRSTGARFTRLAREVLATTSRSAQPELHALLAEVLTARGRS